MGRRHQTYGQYRRARARRERYAARYKTEQGRPPGHERAP
jgi:hypothetical protein